MSHEFFETLFKNCFLPSDLGTSANRVFQCLTEPDSTPLHLLKIVEQNQAFTHFINKLGILEQRSAAIGDSEEKKEKIDDKDLEKIILLLGKYATRNIVFNLRLDRIVNKSLPRNETDHFSLSPQKKLKYALAAEDYCQEKRLAHTEMAFAAGLHFDWLLAICESNKEIPKDVKGALITGWKLGLVHASLAYHLAVLFKKLKYSKYVFSGALILPLGKTLMTWGFPKGENSHSYSEFLRECEELSYQKYDLLPILERKKFPLAHNEALSLYASFMGIFRPVEKAFAFYQESYYLKSIDFDLYLLATIFSITERLAPLVISKESKNLKNLPLTLDQKKCLSQFKITEDEIILMLKRQIEKQE